MKNNIVVVHHLTDIHVGPLHHHVTNKLPFVKDTADGWKNLSHYIKYLKHCLDVMNNDSIPDFVVISGDLTSYATEDEFNQIEDALKEIITILNSKVTTWRHQGKEPCVFLVPGNHDLDWSKSDYEKKIERYARLVGSFPEKDVVSAVYHQKEKNRKNYYEFESANLLVYLIDSCSYGGVQDANIFKIKEVFEKLDKNQSDNYASNLATLNQLLVKDPGYVNIEDHERLLESFGKNRVKIAVMHHNPSNVPSDDIDSFDTIVNAGLVKSYLLKNGFDLVLHGHRHLEHASYEEYLSPIENNLQDDYTNWEQLPYQQGIFILSGDTMGSKPSGSFYELKISDIHKAHLVSPPSSQLEVRRIERNNGSHYSRSLRYKMIIDKPITAYIRYIQEHLNQPVRGKDKEKVAEALRQVGPSIRKLQADIDVLGENAKGFFNKFASHLNDFSFIAGIDSILPESFLNPQYLNQTLGRFRHRKVRSIRRNHESEETIVFFSKPVLDAIERTKWNPNRLNIDSESQHKYLLTERLSNVDGELDDGELEVIRILFWPEEYFKEKHIIEFIDTLYTEFVSPIFVIDPKYVDPVPGNYKEFLLGIDDRKRILLGFGLDNQGENVLLTKEIQLLHWDYFNYLLNSPNLKCLQNFI